MPEQQPILILSASTGAGHVTAARGVEAALRAAAPDAPVESHDVLRITGPMFRRLYGGGYGDVVRYAPGAMAWLYDRLDRPPGRIHDRVRRVVQEWFTTPLARFLCQRRPRLVINTHFLSAEVVAALRRRGQVACPQVTVTTDLETHRIWVQPPTERYYVATELGRAYLATWGVPQERILVTGIPLRAAFASPLERAAARRKLGLAPDCPVVLLLGSAFGFGASGQVLDELVRMPVEVQIVVVSGRNERLLRYVRAAAQRSRGSVRPLAFTEQIHEWMFAADLVVTKPGGLTASESLACGLPLVIVNPIPGQETRNADYLLEHGAAIKVNSPRLLGHRVAEILHDRQRLERLRAAARALGRPDAAVRIARDALDVLASAT